MAQVLSQDEVDALLQGISGGEVEVESDKPPGGEGVHNFDLTSQDRIIRGRLPALEMLHDRFCRQFRTTISNVLRRAIDISPLGTDMIKYGDFMRTVPVPTSMHLFKMEPLRGSGLLVIESKLVYALIDCFFGGQGSSRHKMEGKDFTAIEQRIAAKVAEMVLEHYERAWQPIFEVKMEWTRAESNPQFAAICSPSDVVAAIQCELDMEDSQGKLTFILPYSSIEPIKHKLKAGFQAEGSEIDRDWQDRFRERIREVRVGCHAELGRAEITGRDLLRLTKGDVLILNEDTSAPAPVYIENVMKLHGFLGSYHSNRAVRVSEFTSTNHSSREAKA